MSQKKAMSDRVIYTIIAVLVLVVTIYGISKSYSLIYSGFKEWNSLAENEQKNIQDNFDNFVLKISECENIKDSFCRCEDIFKNFPNSFRKEVSLDVLQESVNFYLTLKYNKNNISGKRDMGRGKLFFVKEYKGKVQEIREGDSKLEITFDKEYPEVKGLKKYKILSGDIFRRDFKNVLYFIIDDKEFFDEHPKCVHMREEAIDLFDSFINKLKKEKEITLNLPESYRIFYGEKVIKLKHEEEDVERIYDKNKNKLEKREKIIELFNFEIKCIDPVKPDYLLPGDKIKINHKEGAYCIEK